MKVSQMTLSTGKSPSPAEQNSGPAEQNSNPAPDKNGRTGVILVNLGTPDAPTPGAVRRYLRVFLSDERIVDLPRALWLPVLYGVILPIRSGATARNYKKIWRTESDESPLRYYTRRQAQALDLAFDGAQVDWAMRYGTPSIAARLTAMREAGCDRILVIPLYPQYSATTTASVTDAVFDALRPLRWQPGLRIAPAFPIEPAYIAALCAITRRHLGDQDFSPERVVISFHGLPQRYVDKGDPYYDQCIETAAALRAEMGWTDEFAPLAFQSKFGREPWLEPAADTTIKKLAREGVKKIAVITPGFVADCIETLEEIDLEAREKFLTAGGEAFTAIPCLNDTPEMTTLLHALATRETAGWVA